MSVWGELADGDTVVIRRESGRVYVSVQRRGESEPTEKSLGWLEVKASYYDVVIPLVRSLLQRVKNHR